MQIIGNSLTRFEAFPTGAELCEGGETQTKSEIARGVHERER